MEDVGQLRACVDEDPVDLDVEDDDAQDRQDQADHPSGDRPAGDRARRVRRLVAVAGQDAGAPTDQDGDQHRHHRADRDDTGDQVARLEGADHADQADVQRTEAAEEAEERSALHPGLHHTFSLRPSRPDGRKINTSTSTLKAMTSCSWFGDGML